MLDAVFPLPPAETEVNYGWLPGVFDDWKQCSVALKVGRFLVFGNQTFELKECTVEIKSKCCLRIRRQLFPRWWEIKFRSETECTEWFCAIMRIQTRNATSGIETRPVYVTAEDLTAAGVPAEIQPEMERDERVELSLWDFAGQEQHYATHTLFLGGGKSILVVLWDASENHEPRKFDESDGELLFIESRFLNGRPLSNAELAVWLSALQGRLGTSGDRVEVLIVASKIDGAPAGENRQMRERTVADIARQAGLSLGYTYAELRCTRLEDSDSVDALRNHVLSAASKLLRNEQVPAEYIQLMHAVREVRAHRIAAEEVPIVDSEFLIAKMSSPESGALALRLLHAWGECVYLPDLAPTLVVLSPQWLTQDVLHTLVVHAHRKHGVWQHADLSREWSFCKASEQQVGLYRIFEGFNLIFPLERSGMEPLEQPAPSRDCFWGTESFLVAGVPKKQPAAKLRIFAPSAIKTRPWTWSSELWIELSTPAVLPPIVGHLLKASQTHAVALVPESCWRSGFVCASAGERGVVEFEGSQRIHILVVKTATRTDGALGAHLRDKVLGVLRHHMPGVNAVAKYSCPICRTETPELAPRLDQLLAEDEIIGAQRHQTIECTPRAGKDPHLTNPKDWVPREFVEPETPKWHHVALLFHVSDTDAAASVKDFLEGQGLEVEADLLQLRSTLAAGIRSAKTADAIVLCATVAFFQSQRCCAQLEEAQKAKVPVYIVALQSDLMLPAAIQIAPRFNLADTGRLARTLYSKISAAGYYCSAHGCRQHDFFISYRRKHHLDLAQHLRSMLRDTGCVAFLDTFCLPLAQPWVPNFLAALQCSSVVLLLLSKEVIEDMQNAHCVQDNVLLEWEAALHSPATVVRVFVGDFAPPEDFSWLPAAVPFRGESAPALPSRASTRSVRQIVEEVCVGTAERPAVSLSVDPRNPRGRAFLQWVRPVEVMSALEQIEQAVIQGEMSIFVDQHLRQLPPATRATPFVALQQADAVLLAVSAEIIGRASQADRRESAEVLLWEAALKNPQVLAVPLLLDTENANGELSSCPVWELNRLPESQPIGGTSGMSVREIGTQLMQLRNGINRVDRRKPDLSALLLLARNQKKRVAPGRFFFAAAAAATTTTEAGGSPLEDLGVDAVVELLQKWGLDQYAPVFRESRMKGAKLLTFLEDDTLLCEIVPSAADRKALRMKLQQLK
eukprot:TRINITY_DN8985_c0_g1_i1.p1 TRINITY_DN8985_c0_g1~~TRINITY_DN8985_c0_g1_i1.p1  ORF type:complete len:1237 (+),score=264.60 TRINITY_DN8985_c0_g1_i1:138-3713(+)